MWPIFPVGVAWVTRLPYLCDSKISEALMTVLGQIDVATRALVVTPLKGTAESRPNGLRLALRFGLFYLSVTLGIFLGHLVLVEPAAGLSDGVRLAVLVAALIFAGLAMLHFLLAAWVRSRAPGALLIAEEAGHVLARPAPDSFPVWGEKIDAYQGIRLVRGAVLMGQLAELPFGQWYLSFRHKRRDRCFRIGPIPDPETAKHELTVYRIRYGLSESEPPPRRGRSR